MLATLLLAALQQAAPVAAPGLTSPGPLDGRGILSGRRGVQ